MTEYPESLTEAIDAGLDYYRQVQAKKQYAVLTDAISFAASVHSRLESLLSNLSDLEEDFIGTKIYTIDSGE